MAFRHRYFYATACLSFTLSLCEVNRRSTPSILIFHGLGLGRKKRTPVERLYNRIEPASDEPETITLLGRDLVPSVRGRSSRSKVGNFA
jgi:hypothetical protein